MITDHSSLLRCLLLASDSPTGATPRARVRLGALATHRHAAAVPQAAIAVDVDQPLDVHRHFTAEIALDDHLLLDDVTQPGDLFVRELIHARIRVDARARDNVPGRRRPDAIDVRKRDFHSLLARDIHTGDTCHALPLLTYRWRYTMRPRVKS